MDPVERDIKLYVKFVKALREDEVEQHILEYITELSEQRSDRRILRKERANGTPSKQVFNHFLNLYRNKYGREYDVVSNKTGVYGRISNFMTHHKLTVETYCEFLDYAFKHLFNYSFVPGIGHLCSERILEMTKNAMKKKEKPDFKKLRAEIRRTRVS